MRRLALTTAAAAALLLTTAPAALADYWFFQGYLPTTNPWVFGDPRYRVKADDQPTNVLQINRMSWAPCSHRMNHLFIHSNGNWSEISTFTSNCDSLSGLVPSENSITQAGCHNPSDPPLAQVWANCRWGIGQ